jgi:hypothetical protein
MTALLPNSQEIERVPRGNTLGLLLGTLLFGTLLCFAAAWLLSARMGTLHTAVGSAAAVRPQLEVDGVQMKLSAQPGAAQQLQARQREALQGYGWVDRPRGIVRIPIEVAIDLESQERP